MAIRSFSDNPTKEFFETGQTGKRLGWRSAQEVASRKLWMLHYATILSDLKNPPGNRLEALAVDLKGYHSIRINDQWRVVFKWTGLGAEEVKIMNYH